MHIVIAGGTGFLGRPRPPLIADGHQVTILSRGGAPVPTGARAVTWDVSRTVAPGCRSSRGRRRREPRRRVDCRPPLDRGPETADRGQSSRGDTTTRDRDPGGAHAARALRQRLRREFLRPCGDETVTEETGAGHDFLAGVCRRWEAQAVVASSPRTRCVCESPQRHRPRAPRRRAAEDAAAVLDGSRRSGRRGTQYCAVDSPRRLG